MYFRKPECRKRWEVCSTKREITDSGLISRERVTPARYDELLRLIVSTKTKDSTGNCYGNAERMADAAFVGAAY